MQKIAAALVKAQKNFSPALKSATNPHFRSRYADLSACVEAVIDALNDAGIALLQPCHECESGVLVETLFVHESGEVFSAGKLHVPAAKQDPQGYGSALTYARRYSLMAACGIAPEDDDGNAASKPKAPRHNPVPETTIAPDRLAVINDVAEAMRQKFSADDTAGAYEEYIGITDSDEKIALWTELKPDSKLRSAIKAYGESLKGSK